MVYQEENDTRDEVYSEDEDRGELYPALNIHITEGSPAPLEFDTFKQDTRGGYLQAMASSVTCFRQELDRAERERESEQSMRKAYIDKQSPDEGATTLRNQMVNELILPNTKMVIGEYTEDHRTKSGKLQDE